MVAGLDPDSAAGTGEVRAAREALDLHLATPASVHLCCNLLFGRVSLHSSFRKKPTLGRFTTAGVGSGVVGWVRFSWPAGHQVLRTVLGG